MGDVTTHLQVHVRRHIVDARFRVPLQPASVTVLFGPSGAGKSTILRAVAGLGDPLGNHIVCGAEVWDDGARRIVPARDRRIGMLFQDHALFPHMSVRHNVEYGLRGLPRDERQKRAGQALKAASALHLIDRSIRTLSGGEAQRVALARALAPGPRLLLLDEPLSALDAPLRLRLRSEIRRILRDLDVPALVVTHERNEALAMADDAVIVIDGRVHQVGPVQEVFDRPAGADVVAVVGVETALPARVVEVKGEVIRVDVGECELTAAFADMRSRGSQVLFRPEDDALVCIRAEDVSVELPGSSTRGSQRNRLLGTVMSMSEEGALVRIDLDVGFPLTSVITRTAAYDLGLTLGCPVEAVIKSSAVHLVKR